MKYCLFLLSVFLLASCTSPTKLLCHTWRIDDVQFLDSLNTFTPAQKEMLTKALKTDLRFTFLPDSSYEVLTHGELHHSKWWLGDKKGTTFYTTTEDGAITKAAVIKLNKNYLEFKSEAADRNQEIKFTCSQFTGSK